MSIAEQVDITSPAFWTNPFPFFAHLRAEHRVYPHLLRGDKSPIYLVTRYDDVNALLKDERFAKNRYNAMAAGQVPWVPPSFRPLERNMLDLDVPDHTRLRALVHKAFTPRLIEEMRARVQSLADELLDAVEGRGEMDFMTDYALPLPMIIITEILGVPSKDRDKFHRWSKAMLGTSPREVNLRVIPSIYLFLRYLRGFFKARRKDLKDDLASALILVEETGDVLSEDELVAMVFLLLVAGHETTTNLLGSGVLALLQHPEQMETLRGDPSLAKSAVEELLRYTSPVFISTERYAREDVTLHGVTIPRGAMTLGVIGSANRDESAFENPDTLDITREDNKHLAFGQGIHYCLGAPLARLEGQIAINTLLQRMPNLRLKGTAESLQWRKGLFLRGLEALPARFD